MALLLGASLLHLVSAQFVPAPTDLTETKGFLDIPVRWKEVPEGICELTPGVKSYSGYVDIFEDQHIFFWFVEARNQNPEEAPLTVWLNGGPGASSMMGLFEEMGPCRVNSDGEVYNNPYAWNNVSNMLFIDQPTQTGFSYSVPVSGFLDYGFVNQLPNATCPDYAADCGTYSYPNLTNTANTTAEAAPSIWRTIQGFMGAFPRYARNEFNFASESYGGHWAPIFNAYIESQNDLIASGELKGAHHINLTTVLIGNGWYDPLVHFESYYNFTVFPGNTYDYDPFDANAKAQMYNAMYGPGNCYDQVVDCYNRGLNELCRVANGFCTTEVENLLDVFTGRSEYDIRELQPDPFPNRFYFDYLNTPKLQEAIGAYTNWSFLSSSVGIAFDSTGDEGREDGTVAAIRSLIARGVYVVMYSGDADYNVNWLGGEAVANNVRAPGFDQAGYQNITTSDDIVHGQVKQSNNFAFARIYYAGHEVPFYQPLLALEMFERAINGRDIASGKVQLCLGDSETVGTSQGAYGEVCSDKYKTVGTPKSTFREGNGTMQYKKLPRHATYNTTTNAPNPIKKKGSPGAE